MSARALNDLTEDPPRSPKPQLGGYAMPLCLVEVGSAESAELGLNAVTRLPITPNSFDFLDLDDFTFFGGNT
jgi:hypothetical protein